VNEESLDHAGLKCGMILKMEPETLISNNIAQPEVHMLGVLLQCDPSTLLQFLSKQQNLAEIIWGSWSKTTILMNVP